jgi:hypothetical protein
MQELSEQVAAREANFKTQEIALKKVAEEKVQREARQKELFDQAAAREAERAAVREERRRNDDSRRNEAWRREIDEEYEIWLRLKQAENEEALLRRERLAQEEREKAELRITRDKVLAWTWTEEEPVHTMELQNEEDRGATATIEEEPVQEMELQDEEDGGVVVITEKTSQTTSSPHEMSDSKVHIQTDVGSSIPSMLLALYRLSHVSFSSNLLWTKFTERETATVPLSAPPTCSWELTLFPETVNPLRYNRFPFDPGGYFIWLHLRLRA